MYTFFNVLMIYLWGLSFGVSLFYLLFLRSTVKMIKKDVEDKYPNIKVIPPLVSRFFFGCNLMFFTLTIVLVIRFFVVEIWHIPTESMEPTYQKGQSVALNKMAYGIHEPLFNTTLYGNNAKVMRDDVIIFRMPDAPGVNFIKRVVGIPGDHVSYIGKSLVVKNSDGVVIDGLSDHAQLDNKKISGNPYFFEQAGLKNGHWVVPEDNYFVIGDNRDHSQDSRYWGFVPKSNLVGRVF